MLTEDRLNELTTQYGGEYSLNHTKRILHIIPLIGENYVYNRDIVTLAAYLHDWGAYPPHAIKGVDHAECSVEVAAGFLEKENYGAAEIAHIAECIRYHHIGNVEKSVEARLLSDADGLDFIGVIGVIRNFSTRPHELKKAYNAANSRLQTVMDNLCLKESRVMAQTRAERMNMFFQQFDEETFGIF